MIEYATHDAELLVQAYQAIRAGLKDKVARVEYGAQATGLDIVLRAPDETAIEAREETAVAERILPQHTAGVWVSIADTEETEMLGGESVAMHTLEVRTYVNVQDTRRPDPKSHGTAANGYLTALYLARAVDVALRSGMPGCGNVYLVRPVGGGKRIAQSPRLPSVHTVLWTYEAFQYVRTPLQGD